MGRRSRSDSAMRLQVAPGHMPASTAPCVRRLRPLEVPRGQDRPGAGLLAGEALESARSLGYVVPPASVQLYQVFTPRYVSYIEPTLCFPWFSLSRNVSVTAFESYQRARVHVARMAVEVGELMVESSGKRVFTRVCCSGKSLSGVFTCCADVCQVANSAVA